MLFLSRLRLYPASVLVLVSALVTYIPGYSAEEDPVVIQVGDQIETLSQFDHQFEMAMVLNALRDGLPMKSGVQIGDLRERYLEARVTELLLLEKKDTYSLDVSDMEVQQEMTGIIEQLRDIYGGGQDGEAELSRQIEPLRGHLREQLLSNKIRQALLQEAGSSTLSSSEQSAYIANRIRQFREQTAVWTWPDRLR